MTAEVDLKWLVCLMNESGSDQGSVGVRERCQLLALCNWDERLETYAKYNFALLCNKDGSRCPGIRTLTSPKLFLLFSSSFRHVLLCTYITSRV